MMKDTKFKKALVAVYSALILASIVASLRTGNYIAAIGWTCCLAWFLQNQSWQKLCGDILETVDGWKNICDDYSEIANRWRKICDDYSEIAKINTEELNNAKNDTD